MKRYRPSPEHRAAFPGHILVRVVTKTRIVIFALPDTEANRAKSLGQIGLPFDMMDGATLWAVSPPRTAPVITGDAFLEGRQSAHA